MKRFMLLVSAMTVFSMIVTACSMGETPPPAAQAPATQPPELTEAPIDEAAAPSIVPVDLAGPPMEVGSQVLYIDGSVLVAVPGGPFIMGYQYADNPEREVSVSDFWIYSSEVTNRQYALCVAAGKCSPPDEDNNPGFDNYRYVNFPVVGVEHKQAADYCAFVHGRLPTEAEWEKAARGPEGNIFPWGDQAPVCDLLNFNFCEGGANEIQSYPDGVSYYGLFDMAGNISEWAADWYLNNYFQTAPGEDPLGPELGEKRSVRSSSFNDGADFAISAHRSSFRPDESLPDLGFRCVVEDPTFYAPMCETLAFYGTGPLGSGTACDPQPICNNVGIGFTYPDCFTPGNNYTLVTFELSNTPPTGWSPEPDACDPTGNPNQYICMQDEGDGPVSVTGSCEIEGTCTLGCPAHYTLVGDSCIWDGTGTIGTECIDGTTYDSANQCCSATPGSGIDFDLCPDGASPYGDGCVYGDFTVDSEGPLVINYTGNLCGSPDDPDDDSDDDTGPCQPVTCNYPWAPNNDGCSCYCTWGPGKCP